MPTVKWSESKAVEGGPSTLSIYADWLEEQGNPHCYEVRTVVNALLQVNHVFPKVQLFPSGSRYYGQYSVKGSDWDFYGLFPVPEGKVKATALYELEKLGWNRHGGSMQDDGGSFYRWNVNIIPIFDQWKFNCFHNATKECKEKNPSTKEEVLSIFRRHNREYTRVQG